ncbi:MAG TPA: serine hydrolase, partial [Anaerolineae bacterium]|nr:serine hydrolase [Anaerolineae bacterium]
FPPVGSPDGGAYVTAGDLDRFLRAVQAGRLLSPELTAEFLSPHVLCRETEAGRVHYGYGLAFQAGTTGEIIFYGKSGINAGVSAMLRHYPGASVTVVLLSNMEDGVWEPLRKVHEAVVAGV